MDPLDAVALARIQFGLNIAFHILFPTITIGLAWILVYFRVQYARTGDAAWLETYELWVKIFALTFAMGVVTGITMSFQFGTNWPGFMKRSATSPARCSAYEVLTAFFLEATFLGVMLFGMNRVPGWVHITSTVLVAVGTSLSAFWILALNSWMQTPVGHIVADGQIIAGDWLQVIFNPSFPYRLTHMMLASGLTASFCRRGAVGLAAAQGAGRRAALRDAASRHRSSPPCSRRCRPSSATCTASNTLEHQPAKIAAIEALWKTEKGAPLVLFAIPNEETRAQRLCDRDPEGCEPHPDARPGRRSEGLDAFAPDTPPVAPVFFAFRVMVGVGMLMIALSWFGAWALRRGAHARRAGCCGSSPGSPSPAGSRRWPAGWSPRSAASRGSSPACCAPPTPRAQRPSAQLGASLTGYVVTYSLMLIAYMVVLTHLAGKGSARRAEARGQRAWSGGMTLDLPLVFAVLMGAGDPRLRRARRLRPRRRHADAGGDRARAERDGLLDRPVLGRQRDLARARRRAAAGRLSASRTAWCWARCTCRWW